MKKSTKSLLIISSILLEVYALAWIAITVISAIPVLFNAQPVGIMIYVNNFLAMVSRMVGIDSVPYYQLITIGVLMLLPFILMQVGSSLLFGDNDKLGKSKVGIVLALIALVMSGAVLGMTAFMINSLWYYNVSIFVSPALVVMVLLIICLCAISKASASQQLSAQQDTSVVIQPQQIEDTQEEVILIDQQQVESAQQSLIEADDAVLQDRVMAESLQPQVTDETLDVEVAYKDELVLEDNEEPLTDTNYNDIKAEAEQLNSTLDSKHVDMLYVLLQAGAINQHEHIRLVEKLLRDIDNKN